MKLKELLRGIEVIAAKGAKGKSKTEMCDSDIFEIDVSDIKTDSRLVENGDMFICLVGTGADEKMVDGHQYAKLAEKNAAVIISEKELDIAVPCVVVKDTRLAYSIISQNYFQNPIDGMKFVAVVGTNGKTSTCHILENILTFAGIKTGIIGTLGYSYLDNFEDATLTTPDPYKFNELLSKMKKCGVEVVVSEVSAHAIALKKLAGITADIAVLTNVTQDHLDFFDTFDEYANTKLSYFSPENVRLGVVNMDDEWGRKLVKNAAIHVVTYGMENPSDVFAIDVNPAMDGLSFVLNIFDDIMNISSPLYGYFNVYNIMTSVTVAKLLSVPDETILRAVKKLKEVEGRFNIIKHQKGTIIIDYAHTPDGLKNLLSAARMITKGQLITVFGCGGNRDKLKRPLMGQISSEMSDQVIITSDNPRFEEPEDIMKDIEKGVSGRYKMIVNRAEAIAYALSIMEEGDTVIIAGKGAEKYIDIKGEKKRFSDYDVVLRKGGKRIFV